MTKLNRGKIMGLVNFNVDDAIDNVNRDSDASQLRVEVAYSHLHFPWLHRVESAAQVAVLHPWAVRI